MMMQNKKEYLNLEIEIDNMTIMEFNGLITQRSIVDLARTIEATLIDFEEEETKVRTIFEVMVEIMQNILSYSYDSIDLGNNTYQSRGHVKICLDNSSKIYTIDTGNLISKNKKEGITSIIEEANSLDADGLKTLYKERRRDRRKNHDRGAGLGFLDMARKSKNRLGFKFLENDEESLMFELSVKI